MATIGTGNDVLADDFDWYGASSTGNDSYAITIGGVDTAYETGRPYHFKADVANTGACTLNINSIGAVAIKKEISVDLSTGDIGAGQLATVVYDGTNFQLISAKSPRINVVGGTTTYATSAGNGNVTIAHGLSGTPKAIRIIATTTSTHSNDLKGASIGFATSTSAEYSISTQADPDAGILDTANIIRLRGTSGGDMVTGNLSTLDATNIVIGLTFTNKTGDGNVNIMWEAII